MKTVFDIGMYDGTDTAYYLKSGYRVIAVEANPGLVERALKKFCSFVTAGQLICVNKAITSDGEPITLHLCGDDLGSSSIFNNRVAHRQPTGTVTVPGITLPQLFTAYGLPDYLKIDIEGADRFCILPLTSDLRPNFISFEMGVDVEELIQHLIGIGYRCFKIIHQNSFRELENQYSLKNKLACFMWRLIGCKGQGFVIRSSRIFLTGHSSGPVPWHSDGRWWSGEEIISRLHLAKETNLLSGWYDIQAALTAS